MEVLIKIAVRNLLRHKGKSIVIGIILFFGALIMTFGNGMINGMERGLQENIIDRMLGNVIVMSTNQKDDNVVSGPVTSIAVIDNYTNLKRVLKEMDFIDQFLPITKGFMMVLNESGDMGFTMAQGVNLPEYQKMFKSNIILLEGRELTNGEEGMMITRGSRKAMYNQQSVWVNPVFTPLNESNLTPEAKSNRNTLLIRTNLIVMGSSMDGSASDIRIPVKGIFKYKQLDQVFEMMNIIDIESFRKCFNYISASDNSQSVDEATKQLLNIDTNNLDALFASDSFVVENNNTKKADLDEAVRTALNQTNVVLDLDNAAYNLVLIKTKPNMDMTEAVKKLNEYFKKNGMPVRAVTWKAASGQIAMLADIVRVGLGGFVFFIFFVAIIVIMNTLSMTAMERVPEIGMMRAVGAQKGFIGKMFMIETGTLAVIFGGLGLIIGVLLIMVFGALQIPVTDDIAMLAFGGEVFSPNIDLAMIINCIIQLVFVTLLAVIYPLRIAQRITPLDAISRH